jgi:hypothetical protein
MWGWILFGITWFYAGATTAAALLQVEVVCEHVNAILPMEKQVVNNLKGKPLVILMVVVVLWPISLPLWLYWGIVGE